MWQIFLIWDKVVHWYCRVVLESLDCFTAHELKEVETLITMKYATHIENMQAHLFVTTKELKESSKVVSKFKFNPFYSSLHILPLCKVLAFVTFCNFSTIFYHFYLVGSM
jgi:hypothetical protein